jgi:hypothetical protein
MRRMCARRTPTAAAVRDPPARRTDRDPAELAGRASGNPASGARRSVSARKLAPCRAGSAGRGPPLDWAGDSLVARVRHALLDSRALRLRVFLAGCSDTRRALAAARERAAGLERLASSTGRDSGPEAAARALARERVCLRRREGAGRDARQDRPHGAGWRARCEPPRPVLAAAQMLDGLATGGLARGFALVRDWPNGRFGARPRSPMRSGSGSNSPTARSRAAGLSGPRAGASRRRRRSRDAPGRAGTGGGDHCRRQRPRQGAPSTFQDALAA